MLIPVQRGVMWSLSTYVLTKVKTPWANRHVWVVETRQKDIQALQYRPDHIRMHTYNSV